MDEPEPRRSRTAILLYRLLGTAMVVLGTIGIFVPLMPSTVFLLVALWAFARGSPHLAERLRAHPRFGPTLRNWEERGAIPTRAKVTAVLVMAASWTGVALSTRSLVWIVAVGAVLLVVAGWIVTRPAA